MITYLRSPVTSERRSPLFSNRADQPRPALRRFALSAGIAAPPIDDEQTQVDQFALLAAAERVLGGSQFCRVDRKSLQQDTIVWRRDMSSHRSASIRRQRGRDDQQFAPDLPCDGLQLLTGRRRLDCSVEEVRKYKRAAQPCEEGICFKLNLYCTNGVWPFGACISGSE